MDSPNLSRIEKISFIKALRDRKVPWYHLTHQRLEVVINEERDDFEFWSNGIKVGYRVFNTIRKTSKDWSAQYGIRDIENKSKAHFLTKNTVNFTQEIGRSNSIWQVFSLADLRTIKAMQLKFNGAKDNLSSDDLEVLKRLNAKLNLGIDPFEMFAHFGLIMPYSIIENYSRA